MQAGCELLVLKNPEKLIECYGLCTVPYLGTVHKHLFGGLMQKKKKNGA